MFERLRDLRGVQRGGGPHREPHLRMLRVDRGSYLLGMEEREDEGGDGDFLPSRAKAVLYAEGGGRDDVTVQDATLNQRPEAGGQALSPNRPSCSPSWLNPIGPLLR